VRLVIPILSFKTISFKQEVFLMKFVKQLVLATLLVGVASSASAISFTEAKNKAGKFCKDHKTALIVTGSVVGTLLAATGLFFGARYVNKNGMPFSFKGSATLESLIKSGFDKLPTAISGNAVVGAPVLNMGINDTLAGKTRLN
jgi:hypothetical protein